MKAVEKLVEEKIVLLGIKERIDNNIDKIASELALDELDCKNLFGEDYLMHFSGRLFSRAILWLKSTSQQKRKKLYLSLYKNIRPMSPDVFASFLIAFYIAGSCQRETSFLLNLTDFNWVDVLNGKTPIKMGLGHDN